MTASQSSIRWRLAPGNAISVLRCAFRFGYRDYPDKHNPTYSLRSARIQKKDRTRIDPFKIQEAETLIAAIHGDWGEAQGNYVSAMEWRTSHADAAVAGKCRSSAFIARAM